MMRSLTLIICALIVTTVVVTKAGAQQKPLFDGASWMEQSKAAQTEEVKALAKIYAIHYDFFLNRPWTLEDYQQEYTKRLETFKRYFCPNVGVVMLDKAVRRAGGEPLNIPSPGEMCKLPSKIDANTEKGVLRSAAVFAKPATIELLNSKLKSFNSAVRISLPIRVPGLISEEDDSLNQFNFFIGIFDESTPGIVRAKTLILVDISAYYLGYMQKEAPNYFALDVNQKIYINEDTLIGAALNLASKFEAGMIAKEMDSALQAPELVLQKYLNEKKGEIEILKKSFNQLQALEWIAYQELEKTLLIEAKIFAQMKRPYTSISILSSLIQMQQQANPSFFFYLLLNHSLYESSPLVDQLSAKQAGNTVMRENLVLFLGLAPYEKSTQFEKLTEKLSLSLILTPSAFQERAPELDAYLKSEGLYEAEKWTALDAKSRQKVLQRVLFPKSVGKETADTSFLLQMSLYGLMGSLVLNSTSEDLQAMAAEIARVRLK
ncbi:MAG: hypothetical protein AB7H97_19200 [Pseudobdellovibrionaceae bacterium]